uniref:Protein FAR1-RELATED SEQUENCE n=1 Tax=Arundo donax TaxID=35708 RepID=A0A0A9B9G7_ARUDO
MDFDHGWSDMVNRYGLHGNRHIASLFVSQNLWALPYSRGHFSAGLTASANVSKPINVFIQRILGAQTCLPHFIEQVADVVAYRDRAGEQEMMQQSLQNISLKTAAPIEGHAAAVLTLYAFSEIQDELVASAHYSLFHLHGCVFLVRHHSSREGGCSVTWNKRS